MFIMNTVASLYISLVILSYIPCSDGSHTVVMWQMIGDPTDLGLTRSISHHSHDPALSLALASSYFLAFHILSPTQQWLFGEETLASSSSILPMSVPSWSYLTAQTNPNEKEWPFPLNGTNLLIPQLRFSSPCDFQSTLYGKKPLLISLSSAQSPLPTNSQSR